MAAARPSLDEYLGSMPAADPAAQSLSFDRMMFDVCGEANHVRAAYEGARDDLGDCLKAFDRSCGRMYADPAVSIQRKYSLRVAEWLLKSWCVWGDSAITELSATRWFDAWQRERNMALLQL